MKRVLILCVGLCLLLLTGCGKSTGDPNVYDLEYNGKTYTVDQNVQTISVDGYTCRFQVSGSGNNMRFTVTYPDGSTYTGPGWIGSYSDDYDPDRYVPGENLWNVLEQGRPGTRSGSAHGGLGILLVALGVFEAAYPKVSWYLGHGWRYQNAEPSDLVLGLGRTAGVLMVVIGVICFFV